MTGESVYVPNSSELLSFRDGRLLPFSSLLSSLSIYFLNSDGALDHVLEGRSRDAVSTQIHIVLREIFLAHGKVQPVLQRNQFSIDEDDKKNNSTLSSKEASLWTDDLAEIKYLRLLGSELRKACGGVEGLEGLEPLALQSVSTSDRRTAIPPALTPARREFFMAQNVASPLGDRFRNDDRVKGKFPGEEDATLANSTLESSSTSTAFTINNQPQDSGSGAPVSANSE